MSRSRRGLNVCIVTAGHIGSNPRVVKEADALHDAGHEVRVIAARVLDLVEPLDQALMRRIPWRLERVDLRSAVRRRLRRAVQLCARHAYAAFGISWCADPGLAASARLLRRAALATSA